jgi:hypothetical protein
MEYFTSIKIIEKKTKNVSFIYRFIWIKRNTGKFQVNFTGFLVYETQHLNSF